MKPCYEGLKEIRVDVNEIWRKILCFGVSIGLLPLILIVSWNETLLWMFERNRSWCQWDMRENVRFWSKYRVVTPYFYRFVKRNPFTKFSKKSELMSNEIWGKMLCFGASIGLLPLILIVLWNETLLWKFSKKSELMSIRYEGKCCVLE